MSFFDIYGKRRKSAATGNEDGVANKPNIQQANVADIINQPSLSFELRRQIACDKRSLNDIFHADYHGALVAAAANMPSSPSKLKVEALEAVSDLTTSIKTIEDLGLTLARRERAVQVDFQMAIATAFASIETLLGHFPFMNGNLWTLMMTIQHRVE